VEVNAGGASSGRGRSRGEWTGRAQARRPRGVGGRLRVDGGLGCRLALLATHHAHGLVGERKDTFSAGLLFSPLIDGSFPPSEVPFRPLAK